MYNLYTVWYVRMCNFSMFITKPTPLNMSTNTRLRDIQIFMNLSKVEIA